MLWVGKCRPHSKKGRILEEVADDLFIEFHAILGDENHYEEDVDRARQIYMERSAQTLRALEGGTGRTTRSTLHNPAASAGSVSSAAVSSGGGGGGGGAAAAAKRPSGQGGGSASKHARLQPLPSASASASAPAASAAGGGGGDAGHELAAAIRRCVLALPASVVMSLSHTYTHVSSLAFVTPLPGTPPQPNRRCPATETNHPLKSHEVFHDFIAHVVPLFPRTTNYVYAQAKPFLRALARNTGELHGEIEDMIRVEFSRSGNGPRVWGMYNFLLRKAMEEYPDVYVEVKRSRKRA